MPKNRKVIKTDNRSIKVKVPSRLRIGTRSNGKSALGMSIKELKDVLGQAGQKRYHDNARAVLAMRGVTV